MIINHHDHQSSWSSIIGIINHCDHQSSWSSWLKQLNMTNRWFFFNHTLETFWISNFWILFFGFLNFSFFQFPFEVGTYTGCGTYGGKVATQHESSHSVGFVFYGFWSIYTGTWCKLTLRMFNWILSMNELDLP